MNSAARMDLAELGRHIDAAGHVRRLETLPTYQSSSDVDWVQRYLDGAEAPDRAGKQTWLDRLADRAGRGQHRERLRVIHAPASPYERYSCEWGYVDNAEAGERIQVLDAASVPSLAAEAERIGDVYVLDGRVVVMEYDEHGAFRFAYRLDDDRNTARQVESLWACADDFGSWWTMRSDLHRDVHA